MFSLTKTVPVLRNVHIPKRGCSSLVLTISPRDKLLQRMKKEVDYQKSRIVLKAFAIPCITFSLANYMYLPINEQLLLLNTFAVVIATHVNFINWSGIQDVRLKALGNNLDEGEIVKQLIENEYVYAGSKVKILDENEKL